MPPLNAAQQQLLWQYLFAQNPQANPQHNTLPYPGSRNAPSFTGDAFLVDAFLDEFEARAASTNLAPGLWKQRIVTYVAPDIRHIWTSVPEYAGPHTYQEYRQAMRAVYTDRGRVKTFTLASLDTLVKRHALKGVVTEDEVTEYTREFTAQHQSLVRQHVPHSGPDLYLSAFSTQQRAAIIEKLNIRYPMTPYFQLTIPQIESVASYQVKNFGPQAAHGGIPYNNAPHVYENPTATPNAAPAYTPSPAAYAPPAAAYSPPPVVVKAEPTEAQISSAVAAAVNERLYQLEQQIAAQQAQIAAQAAAAARAPAPAGTTRFAGTAGDSRGPRAAPAPQRGGPLAFRAQTSCALVRKSCASWNLRAHECASGKNTCAR